MKLPARISPLAGARRSAPTLLRASNNRTPPDRRRERHQEDALGEPAVSRSATASAQIQFLEEIIALVVDHDEGGEILDLDAPDRLHAELGIFDRLDLLDAVLGEIGGGAADRREIEAAVPLAGLAHLRRAVALGDRDHRAARGLEGVD